MTPPDAGPSPLELFAWLSPAFPVGAFAYSHGLESAVDAGLVHDAATLEGWLGDLLGHGSARQDGVLAAEAWRLAAAPRPRHDLLGDLSDLALALAPGRERRLETGGTGRAFAEAIRASWPGAACPGLPAEGDVAYPVAFGAAAGTAGLALVPSLEALALAFVGNLVSAAVRLGPIGQTDGQRVTAALLPRARALGGWAAGSTLDDLGGCALRSDIAALQHETLYSRLFRS
ncbi:urease accessory protein UreF [Lichenibacterium ramalinae]|uniref:Urease accessory protein UreF n=1 Tax=Lichenibacterium ramalinae TaxID=2316527 RepID=A0A4Q2RIM9_9HYPH|nr:urease accessory UreF family protein [Lichenibacterium ramalinae]RYB07864.1 urease accessory protein UreF [Lichenibacterium ramalinae]